MFSISFVAPITRENCYDDEFSYLTLKKNLALHFAMS